MPTGLQICAKVLQMHLSGGGGTPWLKPKSNVTFESAPSQLLMIFLLILDSNIVIIVATVPIGFQACAKVLQMDLSGGGGTPWLKPKDK